MEAGYKSGAVSVLVATSTLAAGVNLPARRVLFCEPCTWNGIAMEMLDSTKWVQSCDHHINHINLTLSTVFRWEHVTLLIDGFCLHADSDTDANIPNLYAVWQVVMRPGQQYGH